MSWCFPLWKNKQLYDGFDFNTGIRNQRQEVVGASVGSLICASSPNSGNLFYNGSGPLSPVNGSGLQFAKANYAAYCSPHHVDLELYFPGALGGFKPGSKIGQKLRKVKDGLSGTILAADVRASSPNMIIVVSGRYRFRDRAYWRWIGTTNFSPARIGEG